MFWFLVRDPRERQLHHVALARFISPLGASTAGLAYHQSRIFDGVTQSVGHHRIFPIDEGLQPVVLPQEIPGVALLGLLEDKA